MNLPPMYYMLLIAVAGMVLGMLIVYFLAAAKKQKITQIQSELQGAQQLNKLHENSILELKSKNDALELEAREKAVAIARLETEKKSLQTQIVQHQADVEKMQEKFTKDFQILANQILEEKSEKFTTQNKQNIDEILTPLKEKINEFQKKIEETHHSNLKETSSLRQELKHLKDISHKMTAETENLTRALKNDSKMQGNWGEMILESILENSGLKQDREYFTQKSFTTPNGNRLQPDVMIKLPDDKWIVIDSKVSLKAYEDYLNDEDKDSAQESLKLHLQSLRNHIKSLSEKGYQHLGTGKNLDFILMFIPIEPAYLLALQKDHRLFHDAYAKNIILVSPTTLIAALKIISATWKHEFQNKNAMEIADRGRKLLEKFIGFTQDFEKIGDHLDRTKTLYTDALGKLRDGRGSLVSQAQKLEELGVKTDKSLSEHLLTQKKLT